jgi:hypothetical protein
MVVLKILSTFGIKEIKLFLIGGGVICNNDQISSA